jgi:hypothetical protein
MACVKEDDCIVRFDGGRIRPGRAGAFRVVAGASCAERGEDDAAAGGGAGEEATAELEEEAGMAGGFSGIGGIGRIVEAGRPGTGGIGRFGGERRGRAKKDDG